MKKLTKKIVSLPTLGVYVKDWQIHGQGELYVEKTLDIFQACNVADDHFEKFFQDKGLHWTVEYTAELKHS